MQYGNKNKIFREQETPGVILGAKEIFDFVDSRYSRYLYTEVHYNWQSDESLSISKNLYAWLQNLPILWSFSLIYC